MARSKRGGTEALFVSIRACFIGKTSNLSAVYSKEGEEKIKRKIKNYLLNQNENCDLMKTLLYLSLSLVVASSLQEDDTFFEKPLRGSN